MDLQRMLIEFQDYLAPKLDTYEQAIYLYIFRHSRLIDKTEVVIGFKSARSRMAFGVGEFGKPMSENSCYKKLRSLAAKGCVEIIGTERSGTRLRLFFPEEIKGLIQPQVEQARMSLEDLDFFSVPEHRTAIFSRENGNCFYCLRKIDSSNYVIEHVVSRPHGDNSYRNLVAACCSCNNRKGASLAEDFIRVLYRDGYLNAEDFEARSEALQLLRKGDLKPILIELQ